MTGTAEPGDGLHAIVLAAGESSRFGSAKQLVRVAGRPLLHSAVTRAAGVAGSAVTIVLGSRAAEFSPLLNHTPANIVINRDWREGMASSIRAGISRLPASCTAALLMTVDQAALTSADLMRLVTSWRAQPDRIVAAHYGTVTGIPAIFPRAYFFELSSLRGDVGARSILQRNRDQVTRVPMTRAAIDIDTPEDLLKLSADP